MLRRRTATVIGALCVSIAVVGAPAASGQYPSGGTVQGTDTGSQEVITDLPVLSELPPLPSDGDVTEVPVGDGEPTFGMSGVQSAALTLAAVVLVAGAIGLTLVTRRSRAMPPVERPAAPGPAV